MRGAARRGSKAYGGLVGTSSAAVLIQLRGGGQRGIGGGRACVAQRGVRRRREEVRHRALCLTAGTSGPKQLSMRAQATTKVNYMSQQDELWGE